MNFFYHKDLGITSCSYALKSWSTLYVLDFCVVSSDHSESMAPFLWFLICELVQVLILSVVVDA